MSTTYDSATIFHTVYALAQELYERGGHRAGEMLVVGASTSEVVGRSIGQGGARDVGQAIVDGIQKFAMERHCAVAYQCCEHLNRALVVSATVVERYALECVRVVPVPTAGGMLAAMAYATIPEAKVVECVCAHFALDIGETLIGMHLRAVAVPVRLSVRHVGQARITAATTRPKLIGGARAVYETCGSSS